MRVQKLNVVREIDARDFPRWERNGYKKIGESMPKPELPAQENTEKKK